MLYVVTVLPLLSPNSNQVVSLSLARQNPKRRLFPFNFNKRTRATRGAEEDWKKGHTQRERGEEPEAKIHPHTRDRAYGVVGNGRHKRRAALFLAERGWSQNL
jgi:hypothetical protein